MKRKRFSEEQITAILREHEANVATSDLCRKHGMSSANLYAWKAKFGGRNVSDAQKLRAGEAENAKVKRLSADQIIDNAGLKDQLAKIMVTPAQRREAVAHLIAGRQMSERRACRVAGVERAFGAVPVAVPGRCGASLSFKGFGA